MNPLIDSYKYRSLSMLALAKEARTLFQHQGLYGESNEGLLIGALRQYVGDEWRVGSGEIIDVNGNRSPQADIIVYAANNLPEAFRSPSGKIVVFAHAVGAVVEVKSSLLSCCGDKKDGDVKKLLNQMRLMRDFLDEAMTAGNEKMKTTPGIAKDLVSKFKNKPIPLYGFSYETGVDANSILKCVESQSTSLGKVLAFSVLDVKRSADEVKTKADMLRLKSAEEVTAFVDAMRLPNGYEFSTTLGMQAKEITWSAYKVEHGPDCLRVFVKALLDTARTMSPASVDHQLTKAEYEKIYSCYNTWDNTYTKMSSGNT